MKPIRYWFRFRIDDEHKYDCTQRACLATVWLVLLLRPYLKGTRLTIHTDHNSLKWISNLLDSSSRLARWQLRFSEYTFEIVYYTGIKHPCTDALFRLPTDGGDTTPLENDPLLLAIDAPDSTSSVGHFVDTISYTRKSRKLSYDDGK